MPKRIISCAIGMLLAQSVFATDVPDTVGQPSCFFWTLSTPQSMHLETSDCLRISWSVPVGRHVQIEPYRYLHRDMLGNSETILAGGAVVNSRLSILPGSPKLSLDVGTRTPRYWNPARDPIWSTTVSLGYQASMNVELGPHVSQEWDTVAGQVVNRRRTYGLYVNWRF